MRTISGIPGVNPFAPNAPFLYPLKTGCTEVQDVFRGYRNGALGTNVLIFPVNSKSLLNFRRYLYFRTKYLEQSKGKETWTGPENTDTGVKCFLTTIAKILFLEGRLGTKPYLHSMLRLF